MIFTRKSNWHFSAIFLLAAVFFLVGSNRIPVPPVDGTVRATLARNIIDSGAWWPLQYEGHVFVDHPPLYVWLTALSFKFFGVQDFSALIVPRAFAFGTVLATAAIAIEAGLGVATALLAVLVLCLTRDFVLSSVRGYIEPLLSFFFYTGLWFVLRQKHTRHYWPSFFAAICTGLGFFAKGPVALWPTVFFSILLGWNGQTAGRRWKYFWTYFGTLVGFLALWAGWITIAGQWPVWHEYFEKQLVGSALEGRGGAQTREPFFFAKILLKFYWPWLPLLLWSGIRFLRKLLNLNLSRFTSYNALFAIFGFGFVGGFSLMTWKFWYYIAPAYPAFALWIAANLMDSRRLRPVTRWLDGVSFAKAVTYVAIAGLIVLGSFPISLHRERVQEVMDFRHVIRAERADLPIYFVRSQRDHNLIGTSGAWYFGRTVEKVDEAHEAQWSQTLAGSRKRAWVLTDESTCLPSQRPTWCESARVVQVSKPTALMLYEGPGSR